MKNHPRLITGSLCIVILVILSISVIPLVREWKMRKRLDDTANRGRNIYVSLFARSLENPLDPTPAWPQADGSMTRKLGYSRPALELEPSQAGAFNTEEYAHDEENSFRDTTLSPLSTVSIDVDTASYANLRRFLMQRLPPPAGAVRLEEMVNYFRYTYPPPTAESPLSFTPEYSECPWKPEHRLLRLGLQGRTVPHDLLPPSNLVFLLDVSGSMDDARKLPLLLNAMELLVEQLRNEDRVAIVVYAGAAGLVLPPTPASKKYVIRRALGQLRAGGTTAGGAGIQLAYQIAEATYRAGGNNRVILATDGDFNVGVSSESELTRLIEEKRKTGIYLTVLGFGTGNYKDAKMESLADHGNGNYAYIDTLREAEKVLVRELGGTLYTIANDVKIQIEFNPAHVQAYRLLGYENRTLNPEDFADDAKDAGELGAGHTVTFLYEIVPPGDDLVQTGSLRYQKPLLSDAARAAEELATIDFRYKLPGETHSRLLTRQIPAEGVPIEQSTPDFRFAAAVAEWALLLKDSPHQANADYEDVLLLASSGIAEDSTGDRGEFLDLVRISRSLAERQPVADTSIEQWPRQPGDRRFADSTKFFQWIVDSGVMNVGTEFFCLPDPDGKQHRTTLNRGENIWCVPVGVNDSMRDGTPVLFTRNIAVTNLSELTGPIRGTLNEASPFGTNALVVVLNGGSCLTLYGENLDRRWEDLLPGTPQSYAVLRP